MRAEILEAACSSFSELIETGAEEEELSTSVPQATQITSDLGIIERKAWKGSSATPRN
jgi:hypothetical protein